MNKKKTGYNYIPVFWMASGTSSAWVVSRYKFKGRKIIEWLQ